MDEAAPLHRSRSKPAKDEVDRCWRVAIIAALATFVTMAAFKSSGVIFVEVMTEFGISREEAAWPTSASAAALNSAGMVVQLLQKRISLVRIMLIGSVLVWAGLVASAFTTSIVGISLTYGAIYGPGNGIMIVILVTIVMAYFDKYRGIANGIRFLGETCSGVAFPYLLLHLREAYDFQGMLLILGSITMHTTAFTIALKEPRWARQRLNKEGTAASSTSRKLRPSEDSHSGIPSKASSNTATNATETPTSPCATLLNPVFYIIVTSSAICHYSHIVFMTTIVDYGKDRGSPLVRATSVVVYSSATDIIGHLVLPLLADRNYLRRSSLVMGCHMLLGLSMMLLPHVYSFTWLLINSSCVTMLISCMLTMKAVLMADYLGLEYISACYGATGLVSLPLNLTAPLVVGKLLRI
ncbi:unnamed protein product, partial [Ixodes hexagonus]